MNTCKECEWFGTELDEAGYCKHCRPDSFLSNSPQIHAQATKRSVLTPYTEKSLGDVLKDWRASGHSLRKIANNLFQGHVSHSVIQKILLGEFPRSNDIREALGLPVLVTVSSVSGYVNEGAETLGSKECASKGCEIHFIANAANRKFCFTCSKPLGRNG